MIINIRGTSGSGKSTIIRTLMDRSGAAEQITQPLEQNKVIGYGLENLAKLPVYVVGKYETACGGCDGIKTQNEVCDRVRRFASLGHVVFEGLLISHIYGRYRDLHEELEAAGYGPYHWLFLDTPLDVCLANVKARREARGNLTPLDPANTTQKWHDARRVFQKAVDDGLHPQWIDYHYGANVVQRILTEALP